MIVSSTVLAQAPAVAAPPLPGAPAAGGTAEAERVIVTGSNIPTAEEVGPNPLCLALTWLFALDAWTPLKTGCGGA